MYANEVLSFPQAAPETARQIDAPPIAEPEEQATLAYAPRQVRPRASIDTFLGLFALLTAIVLTSPPGGALGPEGVLTLRLTVLDVLLGAGLFFLWPRVFQISGVYLNRQTPVRSEIFSVLVACTVGSALALSIVAFGTVEAVTLRTVGTFWVLSSAVTLTFRGFARAVDTNIRLRTRKVLIVGSGLRALKLSREVLGASERFDLVGFVDDSDDSASPDLAGRMVGRLENLEEILMRQVVDEVLIALPIKSRYAEIQQAIQICERVGVESKYLADAFQVSLARPRYEDHHFPFMSMKVVADDFRVQVKRAFDFFAALGGLIVLAPVMLAIAAAVRLSSPGPVIFSQERFGLNKRRFRMYKFRTMVTDAEKLQAQLEALNEAGGPVFKIRNDPRVTPIGRFLRKTSLDELPQLFNVLLGHMSLVGPRPLPVRDVQLFDQAWFMRRFSVRPGLTCLWQISGRSNVGFDDWITLDLKYIDEWSLALDFQILARTIPAVVRGVGAA